VLLALVIALFSTRTSRLQRHAARLLADIDNVAVAGSLAEALEYEDLVTAQVATKGLIRLLPRVRASESES